ncbi:hypothetical protein, conserved [Plasmodium vivax]|uniref:VIR protein n=1 Tax=Plasmodium vivax TaxID=5855 RepID=A0A1G4EAM3_PLAVI|nr:hypothetical protein, conserved [Plasmodium vivax]SCA60619.1 hypothetical protein, conserved [Plasmodium vivax]
MGGGSMYNLGSRSYDYKSLFLDNHKQPKQGYERICQDITQTYKISSDTFNLNCKKSLNYLDDLEENNYTNVEKAQGTLYLYLWLHDKELKNVDYSGNHIDIYKKLLNLCFDIMIYNLVTTYQSKVTEKNFEILKNLYDLYYKFDQIEHDKECANTKCDCAKKCVDLYKKYIQDCHNKYNSHFCNGLEIFRNEFNGYISSKLQFYPIRSMVSR